MNAARNTPIGSDNQADSGIVIDLGPFEVDTIVCGDCLEIMPQMPDQCVDFVLTDPVYDDIVTQQEMAKHLARILKPNGNIIIFAGHAFLADLLPVLAKHLRYRWIFAERTPGGDARMFHLRLFVKWKPILWFSGFGDLRKEWCPDQYETHDARWYRHPWAKSETTSRLWVSRFSYEDDVIFDPFVGSGTTMYVAKQLGRHYFGCDINPEYVKMAQERLKAVQPRLL